MKRTTIAVLAAALAALAFADGASDNGGAPTRRRRPSRPSGGILERRSAIPTREIGVVDRQKTFSPAQIAEATAAARLKSYLPLSAADRQSVALVELAETDSPDTLVVYPERLAATVNLRALASDGAKSEIVLERLKKQLVRASLFVMGSGSTSYDISRPVRSLAELDQIEFGPPSAETLMHLAASRRVGVSTLRFATYWQACKEGWAPAPTNDVQKAIFEQVKAEKEKGPTSPLKIVPPNAKK